MAPTPLLFHAASEYPPVRREAIPGQALVFPGPVPIFTDKSLNQFVRKPLAGVKDNRSMSTIIFAAVFLVVAAGGFAYYQHRQNTLVEVTVGGSGLSIEKK